uniref:Uncharacterized protein n=1 Tax=Oryza meridionalis TaxID=40149 RepID=A0A0E0FCK1_9ORYZ
MDPNLDQEEIAMEMQQGTNGAITILRIPMYIKEANRSLFDPRAVAIGPYHHGNQVTQDMEAHKDRFCQGLFQRLGDKVNYQHATAHCTEGALHCYSGHVGRYSPFMLMRDAGFILELIFRWVIEGSIHSDNYVRLILNSIYYDLLLLDNQIPFFVLDRLFNIFKIHNPVFNDTNLLDLVIQFFNHDRSFSWANVNSNYPNANQVLHLLDLQYKLAIGNNPVIEPPLDNIRFSQNACFNICCRWNMPQGIPGANKLKNYGIRFQLNKDQQNKMFDVTFTGQTMMIPGFTINSGSKILLSNLFIYDQIKSLLGNNFFGDSQIEGQQGNHVGAVISYVVLMKALINSGDDALVLQREGILQNLLSNEDEVASFFNELGKCIMADVSDHRYKSLFNDVNMYWRNRFNCHKYLAIFRKKHFKNPWTCLSLVGAIMLLSFSCTSMIFAILNYTRARGY